MRKKYQGKWVAEQKSVSNDLLSSRSSFSTREAYKVLRTNVSFSFTDEESCRVIMLTSPLQGEGKSITAVNLAISYAMADCRTIIVDCDMRRPRLGRLLQQTSKLGLSNLLLQPQRRAEAVMPTRIKNLDVLLSGDIPPNPSELLASGRMQRLLDDLRQEYDCVILDAPPVNLVTDALVLAPKVDGVLVLVRANHSVRQEVIRAMDQLRYVKARILGFVLNDVDLENRSYMKKGYGKKYYTYGSPVDREEEVEAEASVGAK